ncbi:MAG: HEAT repeat domain-containing protein [Longimicrobiales bacterium]
MPFQNEPVRENVVVVRTCLLLLLLLTAPAAAQQRRPLAERDMADITTLVMLEDRRDFNEEALTRILRAEHPEVRRRAVLAIARIADARGRALLQGARVDADSSVAATAVFGLGQLRDSAAVPLLDSLLSSARTPLTVGVEAARALGKIRTPESRQVLARYLASVTENDRTRRVIGEALLSMGRQTTRGDIAPILRWTRSGDEEVRWRATWALFRPRDPAAVPELLRLSKDRSGHVRSWAVRALAAPQVDSANVGRAPAVAQLIASTRDADRRVRTEAIRTLLAYDDSASLDVLLNALRSDDSWISVSAAESLARRSSRSADVMAALTAVSASTQSSALRTTAAASIRTLSPDTSTTGRGAGDRAGGGGGGGRGGQARPLDTGKSEADYRALVERWVVPDYNGAPRPRVQWDTPRGAIELELYPGDAPLAVEDFMKVLDSGAIVGTEFSRVVPDFVAQQRAIYTDHRLRDEVTRLGLTRGNLSWASAGLDTGRPGYTLGSTPQPHNEGDFTTLGRVVRGLDVVDRLELGDRVTAARLLTPPRT